MKQPPLTSNHDEFADLLRSLHVSRNQRQEAFKATKPTRPSLSTAERSEILLKTAGRCHLCGGVIEGAWQADHVLSHSGGGNHRADNYLAAHATCNNYRWDYSPEEFQHILKLGVWVKTQVERKTPIGRAAAAAYLAHEATKLKRRRSTKAIALEWNRTP